MPTGHKTLVDIIAQRSTSATTGVRFIEGADAEQFVSYRELYRLALQNLAGLRAQGVRAGHELVFQVPDNRTFVVLFWACILGGIIPVPLTIGQNDEHRQKLFNVWRVLKDPFLATSAAQLTKIKEFGYRSGFLELSNQIGQQVVDIEMTGYPDECNIFPVRQDDIAFIQFSSGSTGSPKGVVLTHKNLITNINAIASAAGYTPDDSTLSWMPLTHDMGIIGFHINPLYSGMNQLILSTEAFIRRPSLWLEKASRHKATILSSPNFGYKYVLKHLKTSDTADLDLSAVRILYNGAEPVSIRLCKEFTEKMRQFHLRPEAMCPVYGLAEASLAVTISGLTDAVKYASLDRSHLREGDFTLFTADEHGVLFANVGSVVDGCHIRIADHAGAELGDAVIGQVHIKGDNVTRGYYNNERETQNVLGADGWLNTGDLGFMKDGCLFVTGRSKDILFVNGQNYYPHDLEEIAAGVDGVELNKIIVAGSYSETEQRDESMAFVLHRGPLENFIPIVAAVRERVSSRCGLVLDRIIPVKEIPRTTSGKLQRYRLIEAYKNGDFLQTEEQLNALKLKMRQTTGRVFIPVTEAGRKLLKIWQTVFQTTDIAGSSSFFELGGNSLKAAEIGTHFNRDTGLRLTFEMLYRYPALEDLEANLSAMAPHAHEAPIPIGGRTGPAARAQQQLYYQWDLDRNATNYNIPVALHLQGKPDLEKWQRCVQQLIDRHDSFRMSFALRNEPELTVHDKVTTAIKHVRCEEKDRALKDLIQPFDLHVPGLLRVAVVETAAEGYYLFIDVHHIVSDGRSMQDLVQQLLALYQDKQLQPLKIGYKDFAAWENANLGSIRSRLAPWWQDQFADKFQVLQLPTDYPRPAVFHSAGRKVPFHLSPELSSRLRTMAAELECTLHALLFAAYRLFLYKYTGQDDIVIGIPVDGRNHPDVAGVHGMFVNSLCLRGKLDPRDTFMQLVEKEKLRIAIALDHRDYPFEDLLNALQLKRDVSRHPIFDTMFVYQDRSLIDPYFIDPGISKFDLSLEVIDDPAILEYRLEYATQLFRHSTILDISRHFEHILASVAADPGMVIDRLSLVSAEERAQLAAFNQTIIEFPRATTVCQLFEEQAKRTPHRTAVIYGDQTLSYEELNTRATRLAGRLNNQDLNSGDTIAISLDRCPELIIAILAVHKAGCAYLPIDPDLPSKRVSYIIRHSQASGFIGNTRSLTALTSDYDMTILNIDQEPGTETDFEPGGYNDLAYIIYTSGTTGNPKGVKISQRALLNYICSAALYYVKGEAVDFAFHTSISFDLTVTSIFTPLITGNAIIVYAENNNDLLIEKILREDRVDIVKLTPSHLKLIKNSESLRKGKSRIKRFIVGGEKLEASLAREIVSLFNGNIEIYNEYGPTEATVGCMIHLYDPAGTGAGVPIGKPFFNTRCYILDNKLDLVPKGIIGELFVAGAGLSDGYLGSPELTRERFIADPFYRGELMYKTGDLAKYISDGTMDYIGRSDDQIKINGYRIEPSEIMDHMKRIPGVAESLVVLKENDKGQPSLTAYFTCKPECMAPGDFEIRHFLSQYLPHYMVPAYFQPIEKIPLTLNGKLDTEALPTPCDAVHKAAPLTVVEATVLTVWRTVLNEPELTAEDNFFEFGGDSIKAVQIAAQLMEKGISIKVKDILVFRNVKQTSSHAVLLAKNNYYQGAVTGKRRFLPIESWFFGHRFKNPDYYNQSVLLTLHKDVELPLLGKAFEALVAHHDGLRLNLAPDKEGMFYNEEWIGRPVEIVEIICDSIQPVVFERLKGQFNITSSFLLKPAVIRTPDGTYLFITAHHLIMDGVSWRILLGDLYRSYSALAEGAEIILPPKTATSMDWERQLADRQTTKTWWENIESIDFRLPQDFDTTDWRVAGSLTVSGLLDRELTAYLMKEAHKVYRTDTLILLSAALAMAVGEWSGLQELIVEFESHGRHPDHPDVSRTIGWYTTLYPVYLNPGRGSIGDQIMAIKEQVRRTPDNGIGYSLSRPLKAQRSQIRFNYLGQFQQELNNDLFSFCHLNTGRESDPDNELTANLEWNGMVVDGQLRFDIVYNSNAYKGSTIRRLHENFFARLTEILTHIRNSTELYFTPSDFEGLEIDQKELNDLFL